VRRVIASIRREMRRHAAVEPVIGHMKAEHRMGRNHLKGRDMTALTPCSPLQATTSVCSYAGSRGSCVPSSVRYPPPHGASKSPKKCSSSDKLPADGIADLQ
jgi:IS5 family transposase